MGQEIESEEFCDAQFTEYRGRVRDQLKALRELLARPGFGVGPTSIGAELEMFLVDDEGSPVRINHEVLEATADKRITLEMAQFNIESNARPMPLSGESLTKLERELMDTVRTVSRAAHARGAHVALVGMLPTLKGSQILSDAFSDTPRYRALSNGLRKLRNGRPVRVHIEGEETFNAEWADVSIQGANTSFQVHLRVNPGDYARMFNAAQLATAPALAACVNSPILMGWRLWDETRVALLEQALDDRSEDDKERPSRAAFGTGWCREGAWELFAESVLLHSPIIPLCGTEASMAVVRAGGVPHLEEIKMQNGTIWRWNRAVYDSHGDGHVRIEYRALPAGPSVADMVAGAAFILGATFALEPMIDELLPALPFALARRNFYAAARYGPNAQFEWPLLTRRSPKLISARDLCLELMPKAREGLIAHGVAASDANKWLDLFEERVRRGVTGARWQKEALTRWERRLSRPQALAAMFAEYRDNAKSGRPLHEWPTGARPEHYPLGGSR